MSLWFGKDMNIFGRYYGIGEIFAAKIASEPNLGSVQFQAIPEYI
jgi:hypothetical protein